MPGKVILVERLMSQDEFDQQIIWSQNATRERSTNSNPIGDAHKKMFSGRVELPTFGFGGRRSIQLSYENLCDWGEIDSAKIGHAF
jgi:hypothetical protein